MIRLKHTLYNKIKNRILGEFPRISYSRSGEDLVVEEFFRNQLNGFFVDIGAFHPIAHSNTYKYYLKGWRGINIDPSIEAIELFKKIRPHDINLNIGIAQQEGEMNYHIFSDDTSMNTISSDFAKKAQLKNKLLVKEVRRVSVQRLSTVLQKYVPENTLIDFMSIDVEGLDVEVLESNDWNLFRPKIICVEVESSIKSILETKLVELMTKLGYELKAYTYLTKEVGNAIYFDEGI
jgi:FkbM family methyltransferase